MRAKNLKASDFAAMLGIQPSAISHILSGRNQPSLEFVKKIKETFPEYNLDWIVFGTGPMTLSELSRDSFQEALKTVQPSEPAKPLPAEIQSSIPLDLPQEVSVKSLYILYDDGTFETFIPR